MTRGATQKDKAGEADVGCPGWQPHTQGDATDAAPGGSCRCPHSPACCGLGSGRWRHAWPLSLSCPSPSARLWRPLGRPVCRGEVHARPTAGTATSRTALDQGRPFLPVSSSSSPLTPASWGPLLRPPAPRRFGFARKGARRGLSGFSASPGSSTDVTHGAGPHGLYFVECVSLFPV